MALRGMLGITVGLAVALGGAALAARRLFGSSDDGQFGGDYSGTSSGSDAPGTAVAPREGLDPTLLEILACPDDKEPVIYQKEGDAERLTCTKCGKRYPVRDGIPVMLIDEAATGPVPTPQEIDAAKAMAPQGKPALVGAVTGAGAGTSSSSASGSAGSTSGGDNGASTSASSSPSGSNAGGSNAGA